MIGICEGYYIPPVEVQVTQARQDASTIRSSDREHMIRGFV